MILLDEPFTGVDVKTEEAIIDLLRELRDEGRVMLVSTHNLGSVPEFCDRAVLVKGTVLAYGPTGRDLHPGESRAHLRRRAAPLRARRTELHDDDDRARSTSSPTTSGLRHLRRQGRCAQPKPAGGDGADGTLLLEPFTYGYMRQRHVGVSALVGGVCAFLSAYLMLKGWSLIGDALSHSDRARRRRRLHARPAVLARRLPRRRARGRRRCCSSTSAPSSRRTRSSG